jgi:hypothetical protein
LSTATVTAPSIHGFRDGRRSRRGDETRTCAAGLRPPDAARRDRDAAACASSAPAEPASAPPSAQAGGLDAGAAHNCALLAGAAVRCWGFGGNGRLGYGSEAELRGARRAAKLCRGSCRYAITRVGSRVSLTITDLRPGTTYHYAVASYDNVSGRVGPRAATVAARTRSR